MTDQEMENLRNAQEYNHKKIAERRAKYTAITHNWVMALVKGLFWDLDPDKILSFLLRTWSQGENEESGKLDNFSPEALYDFGNWLLDSRHGRNSVPTLETLRQHFIAEEGK